MCTKSRGDKKQIDSLYAEVKSIPANQSCENLEGYQKLEALESKRSTSYYSDLSTQKINTYKTACDAKLKAMEDERKRIEELNKTGDWAYGSYVDDFGDKTGEGFISQTVMGLFSNSATTNSDLRVRMFISNADLNQERPSFRLYEYNGNNAVKGVYSDSNPVTCRIKDENGSIFNLTLYTAQGFESFSIDQDGKNKANVDALKEIIRNEGSVQFSCVEDRYRSTKYFFKLDFKYFGNIVRKFNEQLD